MAHDRTNTGRTINTYDLAVMLTQLTQSGYDEQRARRWAERNDIRYLRIKDHKGIRHAWSMDDIRDAFFPAERKQLAHAS